MSIYQLYMQNQTDILSLTRVKRIIWFVTELNCHPVR